MAASCRSLSCRNGAGKSNVMVDAVAFATGCSPATLRVARLGDVQSTETRNPAEVRRCICCGNTVDGCSWRNFQRGVGTPCGSCCRYL